MNAKDGGDGSQEDNRSNNGNKKLAAAKSRNESWKTNETRAGYRIQENDADHSVAKPNQGRHEPVSASERNAADKKNVTVEDAQIALFLSKCKDNVSVEHAKQLIGDCNGDVDIAIARWAGEKKPLWEGNGDDLEYYTEAGSGKKHQIVNSVLWLLL